MKRAVIFLSVAFGLLLAVTGPTCAETLEDALISAYATNPTLEAQRASTLR